MLQGTEVTWSVARKGVRALRTIYFPGQSGKVYFIIKRRENRAFEIGLVHRKEKGVSIRFLIKADGQLSQFRRVSAAYSVQYGHLL
jgi:hypothetical protein